jgi:hypothetical protein
MRPSYHHSNILAHLAMRVFKLRAYMRVACVKRKGDSDMCLTADMIYTLMIASIYRCFGVNFLYSPYVLGTED